MRLCAQQKQSSEQSADLALIRYVNILRGRFLGQARHGHDVAGVNDDEACARADFGILHVYGEAGRSPSKAGLSDREYWVFAMQTGRFP